MTSEFPIVGLTLGDVAGIGPQIVAETVGNQRIQRRVKPVIIGPAEIVRAAARLSGTEIPLQSVEFSPDHTSLRAALAQTDASTVLCYEVSTLSCSDFVPGRVSPVAGDMAFRMLTTAIDLAQQDIVGSIATAPLNKEALQAAGHDFPGHTEILADRCGVDDFAMMLHLPETSVAPLRSLIRDSADLAECQHGVSVAHVTLHTSVASVPGLLDTRSIVQTGRLMDDFLRSIGCNRAAIGLAALNPHGGENGLFGDEEGRIIKPAAMECRELGLNLTGPLPVDTLIRRAVCGEFDGVVAMYHDQGHIPIKLLGFDSAINITLGLPIVRTSPTHGTAFDRAWKDVSSVDASGMIEATLMAGQLSQSIREV